MSISPSPITFDSNLNTSNGQNVTTQIDFLASADDTEMLSDIEQQKFILAQAWLSIMLCALNKPIDFVQSNDFQPKFIEEYFDITIKDPYDEAGVKSAFKDIVSKSHAIQEELDRLYALHPPFLQNLHTLKQELSLSDAEANLLLFLTVFEDHNALEIVDKMKKASSPVKKAVGALSSIFGVPERDFRFAFTQHSSLYKSGLMRCNRNSFLDFLETFDIASSTKNNLFELNPNKDELCSPLMRLSKPAELKQSDFVGLEKDIQLCQQYLCEAVKSKRSGVNILVYGAPGTGKTQFVKVIAELAQLELLEVPSQDYSFEPIDGIKRLQYAQQTSRITRAQPFMLLFDEAEDTFSGSMFSSSVASRHKAWVNEFLETNRVPTAWVSNDIVQMDAAVIRRFDIIINFDDIGASSRKQQFANVLSEQVSDKLLQQMAAHKPLTTAIVHKSDRMAKFQLLANPKCNYSECLVRSINNCLRAQTLEPLQSLAETPYAFHAQFMNCDFDLELLANHIKTERSARICLYGPPGTGKTAFSRWLGERTDMPVIIKRASDLKSKYVGENERNIAKAFADAKRENAILVFDEVDSFLTERKSTTLSWETSSVNELLTQLESFDGVFIASTNLMDTIDQAAMRRFDLKIHLDYLTADQTEGMLVKLCKELNIPNPSGSIKEHARALQHLTPGDFMVIKRQHKLQPVKNAKMIVERLVEETKYKNESKPRIGF